MNIARTGDRISIRANAPVAPEGLVYAGGTFHFKATLPDGSVKEWSQKNIIVNEGLIYFTGSALLGTAADSTWFVGLMAASPSVAGADTLAVHAGWTEFTNYTETNRQAWTGVAVGGTPGHATNTASPAVFTIGGGGGTIGGAFLAGVNSGTAGTLFAASAFASGNVVLPAGSTLTVTYLTGVVNP